MQIHSYWNTNQMAELFFNCQPLSLAYQEDYELLTKRIISKCKVTWSKKATNVAHY